MYKDKFLALVEQLAIPAQYETARVHIKYCTYDYNQKPCSPLDYVAGNALNIIRYSFYRKAYFPRMIDQNIYQTPVPDKIMKFKIDQLKDMLVEAIKSINKLNALCSELGIDVIDELAVSADLYELDKICCAIADKYIGGIKYDN